MTRVELLESDAGPQSSVVCERPVRLLDLCDELRAPVRFGCRAARCTTCRIVVIEGAELLEAPGPEEAELLEATAAPPDVRLACQAVIRGASGLLRARWIGPLTA